MSVSSITSIAVSRDQADPGTTIKVGDEVATSGKAVVSAIPTEILGLYTAALTVVLQFVSDDKPRQFLGLRWWIYGIALGLTPLVAWWVYKRKTKRVASARKLPVFETMGPLVAAGAWFTAMPGSPYQVVLSDAVFGITAGLAVLVAAAVLGFIAPQLTKATDTAPVPVPDSS